MLNASGGGGSLLGKKSELVADITKAFQDLNRELEKTKKLSEDISKNLKSSRGGGGSGSIADTGSNSTGTRDPLQNDGSQSGGNGGNFLRNLLNIGAKVGGAALQAMPTLQEVFAQDVSSSQAGFYSGGGRGFGASQQRALASQGTFGSTQDVYQAQQSMNAFNMNGKNSAVMQSNVAAMSNLTAGMGFSAAQQVGAVQALNSGRTVNMARMIGVNVRGADGMMRGFKDIAKDLWNTLNRQKQGGAALSKNDIQFSLQPGNALDSLMNQYFGNDPVLRQSVVNELLLMAGGSGGSTSKSATQAQGLSTNSMNVASAKVASQVGVQQAAAKFELAGMDAANKALTTLNNHFADLITKSRALQKILEGKGFMDTMAGAGHGAGAIGLGMVGAGLAKGAGWLGKKLFGFGKTALKETSSLVETAGTDIAAIAPELEAGAAVVAEETAGAAMSPFTGGASLIATTALAAGTWEALRGGKDLKKIGKFFYDSKGNKVDKNGKPIGGDDTSNSSNVSTNGSRPLAGNPQITSGFGIVRNLLNAKGLKTASYGKPHGGVDFGVGEGTPIYAVKDGDVSPITSDPNGFGNYVSINHPDGKTSFYGHMSKVAATPGGKVKAGDVVGYSGNSGNSTGPHLHFEVRDGATKIDPLAYISGANSTPDSSGGATAHPLYGGLKLSGGSSGLSLPAGGEGDVGTPVYGIKGMHQNSNGVAINYGGVNITMNFPQGNYDTQKIKDAVRDVISYDNIRKHAVSK